MGMTSLGTFDNYLKHVRALNIRLMGSEWEKDHR